MKVVLVTETYPPEVNGVAMTLQRLVDGIAQRGHHVTVVRPKPRDWEDAGRDDASPGIAIDVVRGLPIPCYPELRFGLPAGRHLRRRWAEHRPDLVHVATEGPLGRSAARAAVRMAIPLTTSFHTNFHTYAGIYTVGPLKDLALRWLRLVHERAACTFVPSETARATLHESGFGNLQVLGRGVDTGLFHPSRRCEDLRRAWGAAQDAPVALYVGRLAAEKNIALTVRAFEVMRSQRPDLRLVFVGDGPLRSKLERAHPEYHFAGMRLGEDLAAHYASGDVFLFASETETFGNVVTEAMASGLLVLAYDYAAPRLHIRSGEDGVTVPYRDADAYLAAATNLVRDRSRWPGIRLRARARMESLSWSGIVDAFEARIAQVAAAGA